MYPEIHGRLAGAEALRGGEGQHPDDVEGQRHARQKLQQVQTVPRAGPAPGERRRVRGGGGQEARVPHPQETRQDGREHQTKTHG